MTINEYYTIAECKERNITPFRVFIIIIMGLYHRRLLHESSSYNTSPRFGKPSRRKKAKSKMTAMITAISVIVLPFYRLARPRTSLSLSLTLTFTLASSLTRTLTLMHALGRRIRRTCRPPQAKYLTHEQSQTDVVRNAQKKLTGALAHALGRAPVRR